MPKIIGPTVLSSSTSGKAVAIELATVSIASKAGTKADSQADAETPSKAKAFFDEPHETSKAWFSDSTDGSTNGWPAEDDEELGKGWLIEDDEAANGWVENDAETADGELANRWLVDIDYEATNRWQVHNNEELANGFPVGNDNEPADAWPVETNTQGSKPEPPKQHALKRFGMIQPGTPPPSAGLNFGWTNPNSTMENDFEYRDYHRRKALKSIGSGSTASNSGEAKVKFNVWTNELSRPRSHIATIQKFMKPGQTLKVIMLPGNKIETKVEPTEAED
jgi:hypothetical protein